MRLVRYLNKPEYLYRPLQIAKRIMQKVGARNTERTAVVRVSWGPMIRVNPHETIGRAISHQGIFDLVVSEAILRLLSPGEAAVDVGANVGHMSGLMSKACGENGSVLAFEPSAHVLPILMDNVSRWASLRDFAPIEVQPYGASRRSGQATLYLPSASAQNDGLASIEPIHEPGSSERIGCKTLDETLTSRNVGLIKIDVEGHELAVLQGAKSLLRRGGVRDIIFEDHHQYPSPVHSMLEGAGFTLYRLSRSFRRLELCSPDDSRGWDELPFGVQPNYLATLDAGRAVACAREPGWRSLRL